MSDLFPDEVRRIQVLIRPLTGPYDYLADANMALNCGSVVEVPLETAEQQVWSGRSMWLKSQRLAADRAEC